MERRALPWHGLWQVVANFTEPGDTSELFFSLSERHGEVREGHSKLGSGADECVVFLLLASTALWWRASRSSSSSW